MHASRHHIPRQDTCQFTSACLCGCSRAEEPGQRAPDAASYLSRTALEAACGKSASYLKSYQLAGINFLMLLNSAGVEGGIVADEMGLGKTCQLICYLGAVLALLASHLEVQAASCGSCAKQSDLQAWVQEKPSVWVSPKRPPELLLTILPISCCLAWRQPAATATLSAGACCLFAAALREHPSREGRPHLIIAPASVLQNWLRELAFWGPSLKVVPYFGADRHQLRHSLQDSRCALHACRHLSHLTACLHGFSNAELMRGLARQPRMMHQLPCIPSFLSGIINGAELPSS